jgi:hypothetical protein
MLFISAIFVLLSSSIVQHYVNICLIVNNDRVQQYIMNKQRMQRLYRHCQNSIRFNVIFFIVSCLQDRSLSYRQCLLLILVVRLHHRHEQYSSNTHLHSIISNNIEQYLQIPLSNLHSQGYLPLSSSLSSKQFAFDENHLMLDTSLPIDNDDVHNHSTLLNDKLISYHSYKYSRYERRVFYTQIKRAIIKKHVQTPRISRSKESVTCIFDRHHFLIHIPTKIYSRQRISSSGNVVYPLLFDPYFHHLVQLSRDKKFDFYLAEMKIFFNLLHSIASQEFQLLTTNYDQQHQLSYTNYSLIHLFRQTMIESSNHLKRDYFQSFPDHHHNEQELTVHSDQESFIPPLKIRRYDHSSYEIKNRSTASSSSSSGMSITQINHGQQSQHSDDRRHRSETRSKKLSTKLSDQQINSNCSSTYGHVPMIHFNDHERKEMSDFSIESPVQNDATLLVHSHYPQSTE